MKALRWIRIIDALDRILNILRIALGVTAILRICGTFSKKKWI